MKSPPRLLRWRLGLAALALCTALCSGCLRSNDYPVISSLAAERDWVTPSRSCEVRCAALDADGDSLTYAWSATGGDFSGEGPITTWVAPSAPGTYAITVAVRDGRGGEAQGHLTLGVRVNHPPVIESLTAEPRRVRKADTSAIKCVVYDPDGDELAYLWTATGGNISGTGATVTWIAPNSYGNYTIRVIVTDSMRGGASKELQVTATCGC